MKAPALHIGVKIRQIGVFGIGLIEGFSAKMTAQHAGQGAFAHANIACNGNEVFVFRLHSAYLWGERKAHPMPSISIAPRITHAIGHSHKFSVLYWAYAVFLSFV